MGDQFCHLKLHCLSELKWIQSEIKKALAIKINYIEIFII